VTQKPYLNIGCGRIILPGPKPAHHALIDDAVYQYPYFINADRNAVPGVDKVFDCFRYPWPLADESFDGALVCHLAEHIPHEIRGIKNMTGTEATRYDRLADAQDGWWAWWAEMFRVLTPGAVVHILSPYAFSSGSVTDPSHTRYITEHTWTHSMQPDPNSPFEYQTLGINFQQIEPARFGISPMFQHLVERQELLQDALMTRINVAFELAVKLQAVK
jgi:hypothetical protein